ncbi:MAG: protocatechuate 3,4-dioxygenase [Candidatus Hinthialibacter antarcticus]|nr:protocatechuate 3,4-dioxygenase [Candidatus Hinthialibacter antarcticus]
MIRKFSILNRRRFTSGLLLGAGALWAPGVLAEQLTQTPRQNEGPFYPDHLPLDTDNDLLVINDAINPAVGVVSHLSGRILDQNGAPVRNAEVKIWQVDSKGSYLHSQSSNRANRDKNFQGFGRFLTSSKGEYYFRTIKPVAYDSRTPHIHFAVETKAKPRFTTQLYIKGEPENERDNVLRGIREPKLRDAVIKEFTPISASRTGELSATFDIVLGYTPEA